MSGLTLADGFIRAVRSVTTTKDLAALMEAVTHDMGFRYYALIDHVDLRGSPPGLVDVKRYPAGISRRIIEEGRFRRDPIIRGCHFAGGAFVWTELHDVIELDGRDRDSFDAGVREGLNDGITVPYSLLGTSIGSCTFAGTRRPSAIARYLGPAQMVGTFAFQAARRLVAGCAALGPLPRLHPRKRDCVLLAGQGFSNKQIARALALTPRTVDGYMTEARGLFAAHDRTELLIGAILAGEVDLHELKPGQAE
jgi:LuxR family quorum-sensing system transcriptional regulator CciR